MGVGGLGAGTLGVASVDSRIRGAVPSGKVLHFVVSDARFAITVRAALVWDQLVRAAVVVQFAVCPA
jgi:hypothetical protein